MSGEGRDRLNARLRDWDPVRRSQPPTEERWEEVRRTLAVSERGRHPNVRRLLVATAIAAVAAAAWLVPRERMRSPAPHPATAPAPETSPAIARLSRSVAARELQIQMVAPNGTRIYWTLPAGPASPADSRRSAP